MMFDVERAQPTLLAHGDGDKITDLDKLRLAEMLVQAVPQLVRGRQIPRYRLGIGQCCFLRFIVARRSLEIDQVGIIVFLKTGFCGLD